MENNNLISVIVPIYNVENYLEKCVYSIINQSYKNLEIILVNDGSTDNSGNIADYFAKIDNRVKVFHKENGGLSDARNYGVNKANGNYIGFVDSDDYINEKMYDHLYEIITAEDADVAECSFKLVYDNHIRDFNNEEYYLVLNQEEYLKEYFKMEKVYGAVCWKLISSKIAKNIEFPVGKYYEDAYYHLDLIDNAEKYVISGKSYYYYRMRTGSITNKKFNEKHMDNIYALDKFKNYVEENNNNLYEYFLNKEMYAYLSVFNKIIEDNYYKENKFYYRIKKYFKLNFLKLIKNNYINFNRKACVILINLSPRIYKIILKKYINSINNN